MAKQAMLEPIQRIEGTDATVRLTLSSMRTLTKVKLELHEAAFEHEAETGTDKPIGTITGASCPGGKYGVTLSFDETHGVTGAVPKPGKPGNDDKKTKRVIAIVIPEMGGARSKTLFFPLPDTQVLERRNWFFYVKMLEPSETSSNQISLAHNPQALNVGTQATYDWHAHNEVDLFVHGHEKTPNDDHKSAFDEMVNAINDAKHFIFITDWSFQPYFRIVRKGPSNPGTIGRILLDKAAKGKVLVGVLAWRHVHVGSAAAPDEHNNAADDRLRALNGNRPLPDNFLWRATHNTATYSHHQKFVVLDAKVEGSDKRIIKVFFGGLDLTKGRHDWHDHIIDPKDPDTAAVHDFQKTQFVPLPGDNESLEYDDWYNAEFQADSKSEPENPKQPWHDIYACLTGPAAWDVVREWVGRWNDTSASSKGDLAGQIVGVDEDAEWVLTAKTRLVHDLYGVTLHDRNKFFQQNETPPTFDNSDTKFRWTAQVLRSIKRNYWETNHLKGFEHDFRWRLDGNYERSIQDAYVKNIRRAKDYILIETQYFISSGHHWTTTSTGVRNELAKEICDKIVERKTAGKPFHCYIICPMYPEGDQTTFSKVPMNQRFFEWMTMTYMIARLEIEEKIDWKKHLSFYFLGKNGPLKQDWYTGYIGLRAFKQGDYDRRQLVRMNNRYMVYVHSKLMVVDDKYLILGSANLNERSLAGDRDTEICIHMWPKYQKFEAPCKAQLEQFRKHLFKEHFGDDTGDPRSWGEAAQRIALDNYWKYRRGQLATKTSTEQPKLQGQALMLPFVLTVEHNTLSADTPVLRVEEDTSLAEGTNSLLPDAPEDSDTWKWWSTKKWLTSGIDLAE
jgi:phosphatidylserine/phosphatidylglycerophosphate/cardiolipin synthase-like enzyme